MVWFRAQQKLKFTAGVLGEESQSTGDQKIDVGTLAGILSHGVDKLTEVGSQTLPDNFDPIDPLVATLMELPVDAMLEGGRQRMEREKEERDVNLGNKREGVRGDGEQLDKEYEKEDGLKEEENRG